MFTIDRFEGEYAVVETEEGIMTDIPLILLPHGVREGDILEINILTSETYQRRAEMNSKMNRIFRPPIKP